MELFNNSLIIKVGDITEEDSDAIVNAANSSLMGGGGVDGAIHRKGGPKILEECKQIRKTLYPDGLPTSYAVTTSGGLLKAKYVIHTVGPIWRGGNFNEEGLLYDTFNNCMKEVKRLGLKSVSFPFISTGAFGFPKDKAANIIIKFFKDFYSSKDNFNIKSFLVLYSNSDYNIFLSIIK